MYSDVIKPIKIWIIKIDIYLFYHKIILFMDLQIQDLKNSIINGAKKILSRKKYNSLTYKSEQIKYY